MQLTLSLTPFTYADLPRRHILRRRCILVQSLRTGLLCSFGQQHLQSLVSLLPVRSCFKWPGLQSALIA